MALKKLIVALEAIILAFLIVILAANEPYPSPSPDDVATSPISGLIAVLLSNPIVILAVLLVKLPPEPLI